MKVVVVWVVRLLGAGWEKKVGVGEESGVTRGFGGVRMLVVVYWVEGVCMCCMREYVAVDAVWTPSVGVEADRGPGGTESGRLWGQLAMTPWRRGTYDKLLGGGERSGSA